MTTTTDEQTTLDIRPRKGFVAFLLSLFLPGLGQVYNGQLKKAVICFSLLLFFPIVFGLTRGATTFYGLMTLLVIEILLRLYTIIDAIKYARRQKDYIPQVYNTWYYHLIIASAMLAILWFCDMKSLTGVQTFKIPTTSNQPTIQFGDWVVGDMRIYNNTKPNYGDIIIFKKDDGFFYQSRLVGLPNDKLELNDNIVSINGRPSKSVFIKEAISDDMPVNEFEEELPNGHKHNLYKFIQPYDSTKTSIKNIIVPADCYYVLGDNRDNSFDSRFIGFIKKQDVFGKLIYSYWGKTTKRINIDFRDK
ncbi:MAG: signal peptidase I [Sphingobacteriaceae bacterium]